MKTIVRIFHLLLLVPIALVTTSLTVAQSPAKPAPLNLPVNGDTIVRFFYLPAYSHLHPALIFRVVSSNDSRLNTAPIASLGGRTPYISLLEMRNLIQGLARLHLSWLHSNRVEIPKELTMKEMTDKLQIKIYSSQGTDSANADPHKLCAILASLDPALSQPRALWELQLFRVNYHCKVPGFNRNAYPEHDLGTR